MKLNLPDFDIKIRRNASGTLQVFDQLRDKYVALTPEEWVRQHFVNYLIRYRDYNPLYLANEVGLKQNGQTRRCDTVVYDMTARPTMIVEYKAPTIAITPRVFDQIVRYNMVMDVDWLIVSNGVSHYCCQTDADRTSYAFVHDIPRYDMLNK